jgi:hypothetical protein
MITLQKARKLRKMIEKTAVTLTDSEAFDVAELFPMWKVDTAYQTGDRVQYESKLYKCLQSHTSQADWIPTTALSLWTEVAEPGQGDTPDNPIPYNNNMELVEGKYYSQAEVVYICFRSTGIPVYNNLADLVGVYVNVYE